MHSKEQDANEKRLRHQKMLLQLIFIHLFGIFEIPLSLSLAINYTQHHSCK